MTTAPPTAAPPPRNPQAEAVRAEIEAIRTRHAEDDRLYGPMSGEDLVGGDWLETHADRGRLLAALEVVEAERDAHAKTLDALAEALGRYHAWDYGWQRADDATLIEAAKALANAEGDRQAAFDERDAAQAEASSLRSELDYALGVEIRLARNATVEADALLAERDAAVAALASSRVHGGCYEDLRLEQGMRAEAEGRAEKAERTARKHIEELDLNGRIAEEREARSRAISAERDAAQAEARARGAECERLSEHLRDGLAVSEQKLREQWGLIEPPYAEAYGYLAQAARYALDAALAPPPQAERPCDGAGERPTHLCRPDQECAECWPDGPPGGGA